MKISDYLQFEYDCRDTQELLTLLIVCPQELTIDERTEVSKHLSRCSGCRDDYESMKLISDMLIANRDYLLKSGVFNDVQADDSSVEMSYEESMQMRFQARLARVSTRRKRRERRERIAKIKRFAKPVSAVAACIITVLGIYLAASHLTPNKDNAPTIAAIPNDTPVKIELLTASAPKIIPAGQPIIAASNLKTLRINNNRRMTLNLGTELSIVPHNLGCVVKLDKGEIYTEVEHDGKPFIVETTHGWV